MKQMRTDFRQQTIIPFPILLRVQTMKLLTIYIRTYFMKQDNKYLMNHLLRQFVERFAKCLRWNLRTMMRMSFMMSAALFTLTACFHEPLDHDCPLGMTRGTNFVCTPTDRPSALDASVDSPSEAGRDDLTEAPVVTCPEKPALASFHEVLIDPEGPDQGREWVELLIEEGGLLDGMQLVIRDSLMDAPSMAVALRGKTESQQLVLIADDQPQSIAFECKANGGCLRNTGGVLELQDCNGEILDQIAWGYATSDGLKATSGFSLSWCDSTEQWAQSVPSPGDLAIDWRNDTQCPGPCEVPDRLVFNEVLYDLVGADGGGEFIELIGAPNTPLRDVTLWAINGHDGEPFLKPMHLDGTTDADGFYLIGGDEIQGRDFTLAGQLQNGPEALYLEACDGTWLDAMTYGGFTEHLAPYGEPSLVLPPGQSLGRAPDGAAETGTMDDFFAMEPTPRAPNITIDPPNSTDE